MYKALTIMAFILLSLTTRAQDRHYKDSLMIRFNKAVTDSARVRAFIDLSDIYCYLNSKVNIDSANFYLIKAQKLNKKQYGPEMEHEISILSARIYCLRKPGSNFVPLFLPIIADCKKTGDKSNEMEAWFELANYTIADDKTNPFRIGYYEHGLSLAHELKDPWELYYIRQVANIHLQQLKYDLAESELLKIIKSPQANSNDILYSNDLLTTLYMSKLEYDKALFQGLKTLKKARELKDPWELYYMRRIADVHVRQFKYDLAESELFQILKTPKATPGDILYTSDILTGIYISKAEYDKALFQGLKTLKKARELKDPMELYYMRRIADVHVRQFKYDLAESELFQILKTPKATPGDILYTSDILTGIYISKAEYGKALSSAMKTVKLMQMAKDSSSAVTFYGRLGYIYSILGDLPLTIHWNRMILNNAIVTHRLDFIYSSCIIIVNGLLKQGKAPEALRFISGIQAKYKPLNGVDNRALQRMLGDCYYALKKYDLARKSYLEMINIDPGQLPADQYASSKAGSFRVIAEFYIKAGQYKNGKAYLLEALKYGKEGEQINFFQSVHLLLFRADSALGNYQSAIIHLQESNRLKDSMFTIAKNKQIEELDISYQTAEKEKSLKLVQNKERLEQVKLQHTETTRNWIIAGSGLLLIIAGLLFRQSRLRRKNNKLITHKNKVITHKNELLQSLVTEKEWLLKEVHHRVKNNLHTVICLLESQAAYLEDDALLAIEKSQHRIYTMSLIHQKLYQSDDVKTIDMSVYIPELVQYLEDSFDVSNQIHFSLNIEAINLSPSQAIPLALLINEAVTNAIKYAFPDNRKGEITISLTDTGEHYKLEIADNGIGMSEKEKREVNSLGLDLMKGLSKEIMGNINIENNNGVKISVVFNHDILNDMDISEVDYLTSQSGEINL